MKKNRNKALLYFRLEPKLIRKLNSVIARSGYRSKSDFISALVLAAVSGPAAAEEEYKYPIPDGANEWIFKNTPSISEEEIHERLMAVVDTMLMPVVALRGAAVAFESSWYELRREFHEQTGVWLTESEIRETVEQYELLNKAKLREHRNRILKGE